MRIFLLRAILLVSNDFRYTLLYIVPPYHFLAGGQCWLVVFFSSFRGLFAVCEIWRGQKSKIWPQKKLKQWPNKRGFSFSGGGEGIVAISTSKNRMNGVEGFTVIRTPEMCAIKGKTFFFPPPLAFPNRRGMDEKTKKVTRNDKRRFLFSLFLGLG